MTNVAMGWAAVAARLVRWWVFVAACATAGFLAVPLSPVASPVSAGVAGFGGLLGLTLWQWLRLPSLIGGGVSDGTRRLFQPALWLGLGLVVGLLLLGVIRLVTEPAVPAAGARIAAAGALPLWRRMIIIYVAAVGEEVLFRLILLSLVAGLTARLFQVADAVPNRKIVWVANLLSALAFAAVHLPAWSAVGPLLPGLALMILSLNGLGGIVFGYVFAKRGIVAAMWAHAGADCAMLLIGPLTG